MEKLSVKLQKELLEFREAQEKLILYYKSDENREMAYLVCWSILERFVKAVATEYRRTLLQKSLEEWTAYIMEGGRKPSTTPRTSIESITLPKKSEFIESLNNYGFSGKKIWLVMDSGGKHRRHRNELAHTGKKFVNMILYHSLYSDLEKMVNYIFAKID